jgi:GntR family transcriptional regulator, transcriptional repressor for pyruvate dehydrogenase complex
MSSRIAGRRTTVVLKPATRVPLSQVVLDQVLAQIRDRSLRPGDRLPSEYELMRMLGVGRSSVREALRGLISLGLVDTRPGRGAVVLSRASSPLEHLRDQGLSIERIQQSTLLDLLEVRESIEGQAAELAARRATREDLAAIEARATELERQIAAGRIYSSSNVEFHLAVAHASRNSVLKESLKHLLGQLREFRERTVREIPQMPRRDLLEHRAIVEAIRRRQPGRARRAVILHIRRYAAMVRRLSGEDGGPGGGRDMQSGGRPPAVLAGTRRARSAGGSKVQPSARRDGSP